MLLTETLKPKSKTASSIVNRLVSYRDEGVIWTEHIVPDRIPARITWAIYVSVNIGMGDRKASGACREQPTFASFVQIQNDIVIIHPCGRIVRIRGEFARGTIGVSIEDTTYVPQSG